MRLRRCVKGLEVVEVGGWILVEWFGRVKGSRCGVKVRIVVKTASPLLYISKAKGSAEYWKL